MRRVTPTMRAAILAAVARCNAFGLQPDLVDVWSRLTFAIGYSTLRRELMGLVAAGRLGVTSGTRRAFWVIEVAAPPGSPPPPVDADPDEEDGEGEQDAQ